jgi:chromosome segregation ATPase
MSALDEYTEAVAAAQREVDVAKALLSDHQDKLRMAEAEVNASNQRLDDARHALSNAAVAAHEAVHGRPVSIDDRFEFERRWDARVAERKAKRDATNALYAADRKAEADKKAAEARAKIDEAKNLLSDLEKSVVPASEIRAQFS